MLGPADGFSSLPFLPPARGRFGKRRFPDIFWLLLIQLHEDSWSHLGVWGNAPAMG